MAASRREHQKGHAPITDDHRLGLDYQTVDELQAALDELPARV